MRARTIDNLYPEVGKWGDCTATVLAGDLMILASHCGFDLPNPNTIGVDDKALPPTYQDRVFVLDLDGDWRTQDDHFDYRVASVYAVRKLSDAEGTPRWDLTLGALVVPPGDPGPFARAEAYKQTHFGKSANHRILTSYRNSATPSDLAENVVHLQFDPETAFDSHVHQVPVMRVGMGTTDVVLASDGAIVPDAQAAVGLDDAGDFYAHGAVGLRFQAPATVSGLESSAPYNANLLGNMISRGPSADAPFVVPGDSGGPLFLTPGYSQGPGGLNVSEEMLIGVLGASSGFVDPTSPPTAYHDITFTDERGAWLEDRIRQLRKDWDGDGVPNADDNCPQAPNPDQANCNATAEAIHGASRLGDVCDPVPCPGAAVSRMNASGSTETCSITHRIAGQFCFGTQIRPDISVATVGSHPVPSSVAPSPADVPVGGYPIPGVETHFRFCAPSTSYDCAAPANTVRGASTRSDPGSLVNPGVWRRMKFSTPSLTRGAPLTYTLGTSTDTLTWDYEADATYWNAGTTWFEPTVPGNCIPVGATAGKPAICLKGLTWAFANTLVGVNSVYNTVSYTPPGGVAKTILVGEHGDHLSASLFAVNPKANGNRYLPGTGWVESLRRPVILTLPDPPWWPTTFVNTPYQRNEALILSAVGTNALVFHPNGDAESMGTSVSGALYDLLTEFETMSEASPTQQWIDLADPRSRDDRPLAVVARKQSDGSWKFDSVIDFYSGLNLESDYGNPLRYGSVASLPSTPMVYSPADDALWTAGGGVLARHAAGATTFVNVLPVGTDVTPQNVKAFTFDAERQAAWIVDYNAAGYPRLLRFAKNTAGVWHGRVLATGGAAGSASDKHYLHLRQDGQVIYARTNVTANTRAVARYRYDAANGSLLAEVLTGSGYTMAGSGGSGVVTGALLARPLLDGTGYHQMVAGSADPVTTAARVGSSGKSRPDPKKKATVEPGSYLTDDPNQSGSAADPGSVLW